MGWFSRRKLLAALGLGISGLGGLSLMGIPNPITPSVEIQRIEVKPGHNEMPETLAGVESNIVVGVTNPGIIQAEEEVTVSVDGEEVETLDVSLESDEVEWHNVEYTFEETGEYDVAAGDHEKRVEISEEVDLDVWGETGGSFAATPDGTRGLVTVWVVGSYEMEFPLPYEPTVEIDGEPVEELSYDEMVVQEGSGEFEGELEAHQYFSLVAHREVGVDDTYEVTLDGESIGTASTEREPLAARYGETDRGGPSVPRGVIGYEPEIVERFPVEKPDGPDDYMDLEKMETMAVTADRIYMRFRWGNYFHTLTAYDRWSGEEHWQEEIGNPADLVVFDGTEYLLGGGTLTARSTDGDERWQREVEVDGYPTALGVRDSALMAPDEDRLYVGLPDEVAVFDTESGDRERRLDGRHTALAGDAVYTWDQGTARRYERDGDDPAWTADLDRESSEEDVATEHPHNFTVHGVATEDALVLVSHVRDYDDTRFLLHCFDGESGEERWTKTLAGTINQTEYEEGRVVPADAITAEGSDYGMYILPDVTQPILVEPGALWDEKVVYVGSTAGCRGFELESGEELPHTYENHGTNPTIARPDLGYFSSHDGLYVVPPGVRGGSGTGNLEAGDGPAVELPEETKWESHQITSQFGYDRIYLLADGYVNAISGTIPEQVSNAEGADED